MIQNLIDLIKTDGRAIVPDFGCFSFDDENKPVLNTFLKFNDGKLVKSLLNAGVNSEAEALEKIEEWVSQVKENIEKNGSFQAGNLGVLLYDKFGDFILTPAANKIDSAPEIQEVSQEIQAASPEPHEVAFEGFDEQIMDESQAQEEPEGAEETNDPDAEDFIPVSEVSDEHISPEAIEIETPPIVEATQENSAESSVEVEEEIVKEKPKKEKKIKEVKVKKKRGILFYVNIILLFLILALGGISFFYMDEVSTFLGIKHKETASDLDTLKEESLEEAEDDGMLLEETAPDGDSADSLSGQEVPGNDATTEFIEGSPKQEQVGSNPPVIEEMPAVASVGNFHIIVGKFAVKENADRLVAKIRAAGYDGKILRSTSTGHTVSFHTYPTFQDAKNQIEKAKEISGTKAYVFKP